MTLPPRQFWIAALVGIVLGAYWPSAHAADAGIDRALVERLVRAVEANARATEAMARCRK